MRKSLADVQREHIRLTLIELDGNMTAAARVLDIDRRTLYRKCEVYGLRHLDRTVRGYLEQPVRIVEKG
jgi:transcriptional regulator of acetoin/glycerol metabolism